MPYKDPDKAREAAKLRQRNYRARDPEKKKAMAAESWQQYVANPDTKQRLADNQATRLQTDPEYAERRRASWRAYGKRHRKELERAKYERTYKGFTYEDRNAMLAAQKFECVICGQDITKGHVTDHCHTGGHVRGMLCHPCNTALGLMKDNPVILRTAADYLERHLTNP